MPGISRFIQRITPFGMLLGALSASTLFAQGKVTITKVDDLPRHSYKVAGTVLALLNSDQDFATFAALVRKDLETDLAEFDIEDHAALRSLDSPLITLDMLDGKNNEALARARLLDDLEEKPAAKLTNGLTLRALVAARSDAKSDGDPGSIQRSYHRHLEEALATLPFEVVGDNIKQSKARLTLISETLMKTVVENVMQPAVTKTGELDGGAAAQLIKMRFVLRVELSLRNDTLAVFQKYLDAHQAIQKNDILKFSGTSMASPNVTNLAGKILATKPDLKPAEIIALIKQGAVPAPGAKKQILLIDPKHTLSLLAE